VNERDYLKRTYGRIIIDRVVDMASKRNPSIRAISEILDRVLGKPAQALTRVGAWRSSGCSSGAEQMQFAAFTPRYSFRTKRRTFQKAKRA
jgi:hypothetical protein